MYQKRIGRSAGALILALFLLSTVSGCAKKEEPEKTVQTTEEASSIAPQESESAGEPVKMPEIKSEAGINIMSGTVKDAAMNTVVIVNEEYPDGIVFAKEDAAVKLADGLLLDEEITVFYSGEIDPSGSNAPRAELVRDVREKDKDCRAGVVSGEVLGIGMSAITIRMEDGTEVSFEQDPKPVVLAENLAEGTEVTIFYSHKEGSTVYIPELIQEK